MRGLRLFLSTGCWGVFLSLLFILGVSPALQIGAENIAVAPQSVDVFQVTATPTTTAGISTAVVTPTVAAEIPTPTVTPTITVEAPPATAIPSTADETLSTFQASLAELGYGERTLKSPYGLVEYTLRLPEGWELGNSFFDLDLSYTYNSTSLTETQGFPSFFGDIIVIVDGQIQLVFPIEEAALEHLHLRVDLPSALLNDSARTVHNITVTLDAGYICEIPHRARLIIHPTSLFSLAYDQLPIITDLSLYPRPFYQRAFEPDQVRFVLPARPTETELAGAVAVAAKLGGLTYRMIISGTADSALVERVEALGSDEPLHEHLIVLGTPEDNKVIMELAQLDALPVSLRGRQLSLASEGPAVAAPGSILTYTLTLTNTTDDIVPSLSLVDTLPADAQMVSCSPSCSETVEGETNWSIPSLGPGETRLFMLELRLSEAITSSVIENVVSLFEKASGPLNANALTTTIRSVPLPEPDKRFSPPAKSRYLFVAGEQIVLENDGVVQELVSPWDQTRAVLVITGLNDKAVYKASQAMSFSSRFPGMQGSFALVREVHPLPELPSEPLTASLTFADLGYEDRVLTRFSREADYAFDIPVGWHLTGGATLDLRFSHSQLLDYGSSFLSVLINNAPVATVALDDETALNRELRVELSPSRLLPGQRNRISVQANIDPSDRCANLDIWLSISSASMLYLGHEVQETHALDLNLYPHPFDQRSDLADILFVLPPEPDPEEWEKALQLAAALGAATSGPNMAPALALGNARSEAALADYHIVVLGRPSRIPMLQQVSAQLPQPFQPGFDEIKQRIDGVVFRLPPGLSLGLIQLLPSPWNEARAFLAVTGTSDEGVWWAADVLIERPWVLRGDLALVRESGVNTIDTRGLTKGGVVTAMATVVPEMTLVPPATPTTVTAPSTPTPNASEQRISDRTSRTTGRPAWLIPLVIVSGVIVVAILVIAFFVERKRRS
jgi:uncharacterized repeat protein (TIGR01451 family)